MRELPKEWQVKHLDEVSKVVNGGTPKTKVDEYWGGSHRWITPAEMGNRSNPYVSKTQRTLSDSGLRTSSAQLVSPLSVILSTRAPIGHLVINTEPMATNQGCKSLIPHENLNYKFLFYFLWSSVNLLNNLGTGATFKELSAGKLKGVKIPLPPLPEQKRIVAILDEVFVGITRAVANAEKNLTNARELFESYLNNVFTQKGEGWVEKILGELATLSRGQNPPKSQFIHEPKKGYVRFYQIRDGKTDDYVVYVPDTPQLHRVEPDDILMVAYRHVGKVFRGASGAFNVALCKITNKDRRVMLDNYLFYIIPTDHVRGELLKQSERSLIPSMSLNHLNNILISVPPISTQKHIVEQLDILRSKTQRLESIYQQKLTALSELKQSILQKAFAGELTADMAPQEVSA